jgi:rhodanese-related sulfurtransferase
MLGVHELRQRIDREPGLVVLDVRTAEDFVGEQGHIAGALNIPLEDLETRLDPLGDDPERPIAIVCRTDRRSAKAAGLLARRGFANARVVQGGMTAWNAAGWPVEERKVAGGAACAYRRS